MTSEAAELRLHERSVVGIVAGISCAVLLGSLCAALRMPTWVQGTVTAAAVGLPCALEYSLKNRRRDWRRDASLIRRGKLQRPVGLIVTMYAISLLVTMSAFFFLAGAYRMWTGGKRGSRASADETVVFLILLLFALAVVFLSASYASHYLDSRPYAWITVAAFGIALYMFLLTLPLTERPLSLRVATIAALSVPILGISLCGVAHGRRRHTVFLAKKLRKVERKISKEDAAQRPRRTPQYLAHSADGNDAALASTPTASDPFEHLKKLAELRDMGVITEEDYQAKKDQILGRI